MVSLPLIVLVVENIDAGLRGRQQETIQQSVPMVPKLQAKSYTSKGRSALARREENVDDELHC